MSCFWVVLWVQFSRALAAWLLVSEETNTGFRTLQFFVSPRIGSLSDKYGRKRILLITMIGNILSAIMYVTVLSTIFQLQ